MQVNPAQSITWAAVGIEAVKILGPAIVALVGTYIALRHQREIKELEVDGNTKLRARELVFESYKRKADRAVEASEKMGTVFAELDAIFNHSKDDAEKGRALSSVYTLMHSGSGMAEKPAELEAELKRYGLLPKFQDVLEKIVAFESKPTEEWGIKKSDPASLSRFIHDLHEVSLGYAVLREAIMEIKMRELFEDYLPHEK